VAEQVVSIFAGTKGYLDDVHVSDVRRFEAELLDFMRSQRSDVMGSIDASGALDENAMEQAVSAFKATFQATDVSAADEENLKNTDAEAMQAAYNDDTEAIG
jgi:F-type H+-transporting ATPase subunit alpha